MGELGFYYTVGARRGVYGFRRSLNTPWVWPQSNSAALIIELPLNEGLVVLTGRDDDSLRCLLWEGDTE